MNGYQQQLWDDLMTLVAESEAFYYADQHLDTDVFRIFNYRLASYTEFMRPNGTECRGHTFRISEDGPNARPIALASLPMEKFWNLHECPATMDIDLENVVFVWDKVDGSLISTLLTSEGGLCLKTKGSLHSDQAVAATAWLANDAPRWFLERLDGYAKAGFTINMEWVAPNNRIVIGYQKPELRVLNGRRNTDGTYIHPAMIRHMFEEYAVPFDCPILPEEFVNSIAEKEGVEGYVMELDTGQRFKVKTIWYLTRHRLKDNVNSPRRLFEAVLEEATDDMRTLFYDDPIALQTIEAMEKWTAEKFNHMVDMVERYYERNKGLTRKDYAIKAQEEFSGTFYFGLAMNKYTGKSFDYKEFLKSKWKQLGLKDVEKEDE